MKVQVHLFALARELAGTESVEVDLPVGATVATLKDTLVEAIAPLAAVVSHSTVAINAAYATDTTPIDPQAEVVLIPPVSGG